MKFRINIQSECQRVNANATNSEWLKAPRKTLSVPIRLFGFSIVGIAHTARNAIVSRSCKWEISSIGEKYFSEVDQDKSPSDMPGKVPTKKFQLVIKLRNLKMLDVLQFSKMSTQVQIKRDHNWMQPYQYLGRETRSYSQNQIVYSVIKDIALINYATCKVKEFMSEKPMGQLT